MPHISYQKSDEISPTQDDRLHVSIDLRPPRVEAGPSVIAQINPLPPQNEAGNEDSSGLMTPETRVTLPRQSNAGSIPLPSYKAKTRAPPVCSHGIHDPVRSACPQCLADLEAELQDALQELLRRIGWSGEQIKGLLGEEQHSNTYTPLSRLLPKEDSSYEVREYEWQKSMLRELNCRMQSAETWRRTLRRG
jgi:hypothetical protein